MELEVQVQESKKKDEKKSKEKKEKKKKKRKGEMTRKGVRHCLDSWTKWASTEAQRIPRGRLVLGESGPEFVMRRGEGVKAEGWGTSLAVQ